MKDCCALPRGWFLDGGVAYWGVLSGNLRVSTGSQMPTLLTTGQFSEFKYKNSTEKALQVSLCPFFPQILPLILL